MIVKKRKPINTKSFCCEVSYQQFNELNYVKERNANCTQDIEKNKCKPKAIIC